MKVLTRICFVRHGETAWNTERRLQGHIDIALNARGVAQAQAAGAWLRSTNVDALYSSDLARALTTALSIGEAIGLPVITEPLFRERRYGVFEGLTHDEAIARYPEEYRRFHERDVACDFGGEGETLVAFSERISHRLQQVAAAHHGQTVVIVAHGGVLDVVNRFVRQMPLHTPRDFDIPNAGLNWLSFDGHAWEIDDWADTRHLDGAALDELAII